MVGGIKHHRPLYNIRDIERFCFYFCFFLASLTRRKIELNVIQREDSSHQVTRECSNSFAMMKFNLC